MRLADAMLCLDCEEVFPRDERTSPCPKCGNRESVPVARWIDTMRMLEIEMEKKREAA